MINVILLVYNRIYFFEKQLISLMNQTCVNNIHLHIICNNNSKADDFQKIINKYLNKIKISFIKKNNENKILERHLYAFKCKFDFVIFLDDDITLKKNQIEEIYNIKKLKTFLTFYGRQFKKRDKIQNIYTTNEPSTHESQKNFHMDRFNYGGPSFSIIDCKIYKYFLEYFNNLSTKLKIYSLTMDDIFLSWVINNFSDWSIQNSYIIPNLDIKVTGDKFSTYYKDWNKKDEFVYELHKINIWR